MSSSGGAIESYSISPFVPAGVSFNTSTGVLSGTPTTEQGAIEYTVTARNVTGSATRAFMLTVTLAAPAFTLSSSSETRVQNVAMTGFTVSSSGGAIESYSISPVAPAGTSFDLSTGELSGTPTTVKTATVYTVTARNATDSAQQTFSLTVTLAAPAFSFSDSSLVVTEDQALTSYSVLSTGGAAASYTISPTQPAGMSFNSSTGVLSGTPTAYLLKTTYTVTARNVTDSAQQTFTLAVNATCANGGACVAGEAGPGGGTVFFVNNSGFACNLNRASTCKYMEYKDSLGAMPWSSSAINLTTTATSASNDVIGLGYTHTSTIVGSHPQAGYAAVTARALGNNWSLPSRNELEAVFSYTGDRIWAWTSNQHDLTANALVLKPAGGQAQPKRTTYNAVIPVRAFTYTYAPQS